MKKILLGILVLLLLFVVFVLFNTLTSNFEPESYDQVEKIEVGDDAIERFRQSIRYKTVTNKDRSLMDSTEFANFRQFLADSYPLVDSLLERQLFNGSMLYKWEGSDPNADAMVMMGHYDVVPVDTSTLDKWDAPPFSGDILNGSIYGRGTLDDKINVIGNLEAAERLLAKGFRPKQTIYLSFGHDEEVGGDQGARLVAEYLKSQNVRAALVVDEGGYVVQDMVGSSQPIAFINAGEKGYVSYRLTINTNGGHSSTPPIDNTIGSLARAISGLEDNQFEYVMLPVMEEQMRRMGPYMGGFMAKMAFANPGLFGDKILEQLNARTSTAPTMINGGVKDNVIPTQAEVVVNFRLMPGTTVADVKQHIIETVQDERIKVEVYDHQSEASPISDHDSESFRTIEKTLGQLFPDIVPTPGLLMAGTDSKHFVEVSDHVFRFYPLRFTKECATCPHGNNEHISIENFKEVVQFSYQLMVNFGS